jgi:hypothetical protein
MNTNFSNADYSRYPFIDERTGIQVTAAYQQVVLDALLSSEKSTEAVAEEYSNICGARYDARVGQFQTYFSRFKLAMAGVGVGMMGSLFVQNQYTSALTFGSAVAAGFICKKGLIILAELKKTEHKREVARVYAGLTLDDRF